MEEKINARETALSLALAQAEDRAAELREFLDNAIEGLHKAGPDGRILWANRAELEMLGYQRDEYIGHHIAEFHLDQALAADLMARLSRGESIRNRQAMLRCRDGSEKFVLISANGIFREGKFVSSRSFTRELTYERDAYVAQARLAAIVDGSDDAIVSKDLDGTVRSWNRGARQLFGYTAEEMVGGSILRIIPPELHMEERDILARIAAGDRIDHYETRRLHKDGRVVEVSLSVSPLRDIHGRVIGASKIARDVSLRREAEGAKAVLSAVVESADDAIISKDLDGTVTSWNPAAERMYGFTAAEMVGSSVTRIIPPELHGEEASILASVREGRRIDHYETVRLRRDGRRFHVSITVSPVRDGSGRVVGASKVARDIGFQREAERTQGILAAIVRSSDDAIISKNLDGVVTSWNPAAERLYGFSSAEMVGQPITRLIPPELRQEEDYILGEIGEGRRLTHFETQRLRKDGTRIHVSLTVSPVRSAAGAVIGASKIARDITAQKEAQKRKDEFLAVLAHELRNPLAPIRTTLALVRDGALVGPQRERALEIADRQMSHLTRLLEDLLDVSRLATGRVELKKERLDLAKVAAQSAEAARPYLLARHHTFRVEISDTPLWIEADTVRIHQVINNLLTNAAKYTDPGGEVVMTVGRKDGVAFVRVSDTGIGFTPEMKRRLFMLFAQEKAAAGRTSGGLGIGLALVREFVERHGGAVEASSPGLGQGSEFAVTLPLAA
jgi:PAS domain S-box-containing protein